MLYVIYLLETVDVCEHDDYYEPRIRLQEFEINGASRFITKEAAIGRLENREDRLKDDQFTILEVY